MESEDKMYVLKRNNERVPIKFDSITRRNEKIVKLLNLDIDCGKLNSKGNHCL